MAAGGAAGGAGAGAAGGAAGAAGGGGGAAAAGALAGAAGAGGSGGGLIAGAGALGTVALGAGLLVVGLVKAAGMLNDFTKSTWEANRQLAEFSPHMARAMQIYDVQHRMLEIGRGERLAPGAEALSQAQIEYEKNTQELKVMGGVISNAVSTAWTNVTTTLMKPLNEMARGVNKLIEQGERPGTENQLFYQYVQDRFNAVGAPNVAQPRPWFVTPP